MGTHENMPPQIPNCVARGNAVSADALHRGLQLNGRHNQTHIASKHWCTRFYCRDGADPPVSLQAGKKPTNTAHQPSFWRMPPCARELRRTLGEFRAPLMECHTVPPTAPIAKAPPLSRRGRYTASARVRGGRESAPSQPALTSHLRARNGTEIRSDVSAARVRFQGSPLDAAESCTTY